MHFRGAPGIYVALLYEKKEYMAFSTLLMILMLTVAL